MFVDTNVFVKAKMSGAPDHDLALSLIERHLDSDETLKINRQIIREFLAVVTRPQDWSPALSADEAIGHVRDILETCEVLDEDERITESLLDICRRYPVGGRQIHDANIVATMRVYGERRLLTFNQADFRRYGDLIELVET